MVIAVASKNHLGLNSQIGDTISSSQYFTIIDMEGNALKKVKNLENIFFEKHEIDEAAFTEFIKETKAEKFVIKEFERADIKNHLLQNGISVIDGISGRIADILTSL